MRLLAIAGILAVAGCTYASPVMNAGDGSYFISTRGAPAAGGTAGAYRRAHEEAVKFCAANGGAPVMLGAADRDVYQSGYGGGISADSTRLVGGYGGGTYASGVASMRFRCG